MGKPQRVTEAEVKGGLSVGFWDIESTGLNASYGRILCATVKPAGGTAVTFRNTDYSSFKSQPWNDKSLVKDLRDELEKYVVLVSYNGQRFDVPIVNTRLMKYGLKPISPAVKHCDLYFVTRYRMRLSSSSLESLLSHLALPEQKMKLSPDVWNRAGAGDREALELIAQRNVSDCVALEQAFDRLIPLLDLKFSLIR